MKPQAHTVPPSQKEGQSPFFSVIVPVYNVAPYLEECLDSVLAQTFTDWECLCTDDGSRDGSDRILDAYARRDPRFRVVHQPNAGVSAARNRALDRLRGQWVWFVDGDDCLIAENVLTTLCNMAKGMSPNIVIDFGFVQGKSLVESDEALRVATRKSCNSISVIESVEDYLWHMRLSVVWHMLWGRGVVLGKRFSSYSLSEDTLFAHEAILNAEKIIRIDFPAYFYRDRIGATTSTVNCQKILDRVAALSRLFQILYEQGYTKYLRYLVDREWCVQGLIWLDKLPSDERYSIALQDWVAHGRKICKKCRTYRLVIINICYRWLGEFGIKVLVQFLKFVMRMRSA